MEEQQAGWNVSTTAEGTGELGGTEASPDGGVGPLSPLGVALLALVILVGTLGNALVCLAVARSRGLRAVTANFYVASLAVTDVLVCSVVMPLALVVEYQAGLWTLTRAACKSWSALDILLSTASILHLCVISVDRYRAISSPIRYRTRRSPAAACGRIAGVWVVSALIAAPALFLLDVVGQRCGYEDSTGAYIWVSSAVSFYAPCAVILVVYFRIYRAARGRARRVVQAAVATAGAASSVVVLSDGRVGLPTGPTAPGHSHHQEGSQREVGGDKEEGGVKTEPLPRGHPVASSSASHSVMFDSDSGPPPPAPPTAGTEPASLPAGRAGGEPQRPRGGSTPARERKAARTIGVVVGVFIACWCPFFIVHTVVGPLCQAGLAAATSPVCRSLPAAIRVVTWVGWCNSSVNPVIYTVFNKEFRLAFKKLLKCRRCDRLTV